ncbi:MAG: M1 family metallopeptidase [Ignavibacteriales bacterium]|nr:M1 family metallopeptidase [Ignavibacteriales bacterium]
MRSKVGTSEIAYDTLYNPGCQEAFDVLHYDIRISVLPDEKLLVGDVTVTGVMVTGCDSLVFNLYDNMVLDSLLLNGKVIGYNRDETHIIVKSLPFAIGDTLYLQAFYKGTPKRLGFASFVFGEIYKTPLVHSLNEPQFASTWLFSEDSPFDKATMDIYLTADSSLTCVSNGSLVGIKNTGSMKETHWKSEYQIATYLICLYVSRYEYFEDSYTGLDGAVMPIKYYVLARHLEAAKKDFKNHPRMLQVFASLFGEYPFIKEKYGVAEFLWQGGAMEHQTITGVGTVMINGNNYFEDIYIHELAHHWWGNSVTIKNWNDIWLNEGFASYSEILYLEKVKGHEAVQQKLTEFSEYRQGSTLYAPSEDLFSSIVYHKGAYVLHMLRQEIGDTLFLTVLREYYKKYAYRYASTEDFKNVCEKISGRNLKRFFDQWVYKGTETPKLEYTWNTKTNKESSEVIFNIVQAHESRLPYEFTLDVMFEYDSDSFIKTFRISELSHTFTIPVSKRPNALVLDPERKLLINILDKNPYE